jgi:hypothetical protein
MRDVNQANESPIVKLYRECMATVNDVDYCVKVIDIVVHVANKRVFTSMPEGRNKPRFHLMLPPDVDYSAGILVDKDKKSVIVMLRAPHHSAGLLFELTDGGYRLKTTSIITLETMALLNGPLPDIPYKREGHE